MRGHQLSLYMNVYSIFILLSRSIYIVLALHSPHLRFFSLSTNDEIGHVGASQIFIILDEDSHLLFLLIAISQVPVEKVYGEIDSLFIPCRVVRLVDILQLLDPGGGSLVELHHIFALHAFIHQGSDEEDGLINTTNVFQWL